MVAGNWLETNAPVAELQAGFLILFFLISIPLTFLKFSFLLGIILTIIFPFLCRRVAAGGQCPPIKSLSEKVAIVTGSNSGIGKETARILAERGAKVIMACRDLKRAQDAAAEIRKAARLATDSKQVEVMLLDVSDLDSVRKFAEEWKSKRLPLHFLINNAGIAFCPFGLTKQGHELQFGTNHLGHFLLTTLLLEEIKENKARVVNVSSFAHHFALANLKSVAQLNGIDKSIYHPQINYGYSKLANIWFTSELQKRLGESGASTYSLHPGCVQTEVIRHVPWAHKLLSGPLAQKLSLIFFKSGSEGAQTTLFCATQNNLIPGEYYCDCKRVATSHLAANTERAAEFWEYSERLVRKE